MLPAACWRELFAARTCKHAAVSYDLLIFAPRAISAADLHSLVRASSGLDIGEVADKSTVVVRGARRRYSFTIDGPEDVEAEDVPAEVAAVILGVRCMYSVLVEGSAASETPYAARFAKRLAQTLDGVLVDQQTEQVWTRSRSRVIQKPTRESRVATVDLDWICLREELTEDVPRLFVDVVQDVLPEALPRRFGEYEPLQGKYAEVGLDGSASGWTEATSSLFFSGSGPCVGGRLAAGAGALMRDRFWSMSMTFLADPLHEPGWRDAIRRVFTTLADQLPAFYATATLTRGHIWSGRSLWTDGNTEWAIQPLRHPDGWMGLPPTPTWWLWLGHPYSDLWSRLPTDRTASTGAGILHESSTEPTAADDPEPLHQWLPAEVFAQLGPNPGGHQPVPLLRAAAVPDVLK